MAAVQEAAAANTVLWFWTLYSCYLCWLVLFFEHLPFLVGVGLGKCVTVHQAANLKGTVVIWHKA
jgi:hypothetical protein